MLVLESSAWRSSRGVSQVAGANGHNLIPAGLHLAHRYVCFGHPIKNMRGFTEISVG